MEMLFLFHKTYSYALRLFGDEFAFYCYRVYSK